VGGRCGQPVALDRIQQAPPLVNTWVIDEDGRVERGPTLGKT
jgi:hypothetical protein